MSSQLRFLLIAIVLVWLGPATAVFNPVSVFGTSSCRTLSATQKYVNPCAAVVDYSFFVSASSSTSALAAKARANLNSTLLSSLPMTCQQNFVRYVCSQIYLKCYTGLNFSDASTYNSHVYPAITGIKLPFTRPCMSICSEFPGNCTGAGKLVAFPIVASAAQCPSVKTTYVGSAVATFEASNDQSYCHVPARPSLSGSVETYDKTSSEAVCSSFVDEFYVPAGYRLDSSFTTLMPPKVTQKLIDHSLSTALSGLKPYLSAECVLALKKRMCYSYYLNPESVTVLTALRAGGTSNTIIAGLQANALLSSALTGTITVPSYPAYHYCADYVDKCAEVIAKVPSLAVNCNGTTTNTDGTVYRNFPDGKQLMSHTTRILTLPIASPTASPSSTPITASPTATMSLPLSLSFYSNATTSAYFDSSSYSYTVKCPTGYSVPSDPDSPYVQWVTGTGCAVNCMVPLWTTSEWDTLILTTEKVPIFGFISAGLMLVFLIFTKEIFNSPMLVVYSILALIASGDGIRFNASQSTFEERMCVTETVYLAQAQSPTGNYDSCMRQAGVLVYTFQAIVACLSMLALQYALRISTSSSANAVSRSKWFPAVQLVVVLGGPAVTTAIASSKNLFGFNKSRSLCFIRTYPYAEKDMDVALVGIPVLIYTLFGLISIIVGIIEHFSNRNNSRSSINVTSSDVEAVPVPTKDLDQPISNEPGTRDDLPSLWPPADGTGETAVTSWLITIFFSGAFIIPFLVRMGVQYKMLVGYVDAFVNWTKCVFSNYDGVSDSSFTSVCGVHVSHRPTFGIERMYPFMMTGNAIIVFPAFAISYLLVFYWRSTHEKNNVSRLPQTRVVVVQPEEQNIATVVDVVQDAQL